ncbi:MAG: hypothetical protein ACFKPT_31885 [Gloeotrichia echinulata GP01]
MSHGLIPQSKAANFWRRLMIFRGARPCAPTPNRISLANGRFNANTVHLRKIVGWVEALRNPTKPPNVGLLFEKAAPTFLNPTYMGQGFWL